MYLHAIDNDLPLPIGTLDVGVLDVSVNDEDQELWDAAESDDDATDPSVDVDRLVSDADFRAKAEEIYNVYAKKYLHRFKWLQSGLFEESLAKDLLRDSKALMKILKDAGPWNTNRDPKLFALLKLLRETHPQQKILLFSQFADTVNYLHAELKRRGVTAIAGVTGDTENPTAVAQRFSPASNERRDQITADRELRVVLATDVLSEGQNLQDCAIVVNYDLPWAIIRLIQRAGRVDRIGQQSDTILCYSFLPADGVERIIRLRSRVQQRLQENAEVVGTDEAFFDDDQNEQPLLDLYHEKAGILDGDDDAEVDLASYAYQIWKNAIDRAPTLEKTIPALPNVVYSTRTHAPKPETPEGVLLYLKTAEGTDALAWVNTEGRSVTESQFAILKAAECKPKEPAVERHDRHHEMVARGVKLIVETEKSVGGQLGRPSGARFRTYERLKAFADDVKGTLLESPELNKAIDDIYKYPLLQSATDSLNRQLKSGVGDAELADLVIALRQDVRLCRVTDDDETAEPHVICSLGLRSSS